MIRKKRKESRLTANPRDNLTQVNVALLTLSTTARLLFGPLPYEITLIIIEVTFYCIKRQRAKTEAELNCVHYLLLLGNSLMCSFRLMVFRI